MGSADFGAIRIRPQPGWAVCRMVPTNRQSPSGLLYGRDVADDKTTEGVCEVLSVSPQLSESGSPVPTPFGVGDKILFREFLKNANQIGDMVGEKSNSVFLLNIKDAMAVLSGNVTVGHYGEYQL